MQGDFNFYWSTWKDITLKAKELIKRLILLQGGSPLSFNLSLEDNYIEEALKMRNIDDANPKIADENEQSVQQVLSIIQEARKPGEGAQIKVQLFSGSVYLDNLDIDDADIDDIEMSGDFVYTL
ncbi:hypothetical protein ACFE04_000733 [Oxalis oulophora]